MINSKEILKLLRKKNLTSREENIINYYAPDRGY